jgi:hypothetical protein
MKGQKLSDLEIKVRIVPTRVRWPEADAGAAWSKAHLCVRALEDLVRDVDNSCLDVEQKRLSSSELRESRAGICYQAMAKLVNFRAFDVAERALCENINALERLDNRNPGQVVMLDKMKRGQRELSEGIEATRRMVRDRCKMREGVHV